VKIDHAQILRIAKLARLALREDETQSYAESLSAILDYVDQLGTLDTSAVEPMAHPLDLAQRLRSDHVSAPDRREAFQAIAPETSKGLYLVPRVVE
jgi:aspartyl-tRNA(Asn)/glutamyl-tRNA(Gln) amidotransferase subunit C